ncbi:MAG: type IV toxin-antitoxin system AbiEi family antitoxin domain-containing protein [Aeromicrobium sp.]
MDDLIPVAEINGGYLLRRHLIEIGYSDRWIRRAVKAGWLTRLRHGTYTPTELHRRRDADERYRVLVRSVLDRLGPSVAATHQSAAVLHGLDMHGVKTDKVHVTRLDGLAGHTEAGIVHHAGQIDPDRDLVVVDGLLVTRVQRAVVETASQSSIEAGMVVASSALRLAQFSKEELEDHAATYERWRGTRAARIAVRLSDGRLETVGEVRSLHMMWRHGIPYPELQFEVRTVNGVVIARTDFAWIRCRHTGEFDGMKKYGRLNPFTSDPGRTIENEKVREDLVRDQLVGMSRWGWAGLEPAAQKDTADMIKRGMERSERLYVRGRTIIPLG